MKIAVYRKLIAAIVGIVAVKVGPDLMPEPNAMVDAILMVGAAFGVWAIPNESPE